MSDRRDKKRRTAMSREDIEKALELPAGIFGGAHIELRSDREAVIDGRCTVLEYTDTVVRVNTGSGIVKICGCDLNICALNRFGMTVRGIIGTLDFTT